ncbi:hypothetical protein CAPTEDRAFT_226347 [Capitella teleta]|uniref:Transmembrane protein 127 transmembrane region domain-containing protein n=1 Tax=Capitella teleta TaxID=283909 RepID=R7TY44_CAPTE|nr:hypothetical protein CAPTEDRAFT_226347 [Capitella teleta]|eukprot:ELT98562.1 hypothetical protein CAPTEDRAFT_226347 [Capitella teleta]
MSSADERATDGGSPSPPNYETVESQPQINDDQATSPSAEDCMAPVQLPPLPQYSRGSRHVRRRHRRRHIFRFKRKESNILAAVVNMVVMLLLCTAMAEPQWFYLRGGGCRHTNLAVPSQYESIHYLGVTQFLYMGQFVSQLHQDITHGSTVYYYGPGTTSMMTDCVTEQIVSVMKGLITLCFLGILLSLLSFLADLTGPTYRPFKLLRRNGVFSIIVVIVCVILSGMCFWVTELLQVFQLKTKLHDGSKAIVQFSVSFYLVTAAGAMSVMAAACNLLKRHSSSSCSSSVFSSSASHAYRETFDARDREHLLDDYDGMDLGMGRLAFYPPPPPYTPIPQNDV